MLKYFWSLIAKSCVILQECLNFYFTSVYLWRQNKSHINWKKSNFTPFLSWKTLLISINQKQIQINQEWCVMNILEYFSISVPLPGQRGSSFAVGHLPSATVLHGWFLPQSNWDVWRDMARLDKIAILHCHLFFNLSNLYLIF